MNHLINGVHDPTIIEHERTFYLFSTDTNQPSTSGVPIRSSKDCIHWNFEKTALENGVPPEAYAWTEAKGLWAPEVIRYNNEYRMYYSASTFGSTTSFIGLATASHPLKEWTDQGEVVKTSRELAEHNAIDANICIDREGNQWLSYGSFFGGIYIAPIDKTSGKLKDSNNYGKLIAIRSAAVDGAIEGAFIYYNEKTDYFYLFVSFDSLNETYSIRVGRAREITGPYVDRNGNELTDLTKEPEIVGTKLLGSYQYLNDPPLYGPGHNSIFRRSDGVEMCVHHMRRAPYSEDFFVVIRQLYWLSDGWPVVSADFYQGDQPTVKIELEDFSGDWEIISFDKGNELVVAVRHSLGDVVVDAGHYYCRFGEFVPYWQPSGDSIQLELSGISDTGYAFIGRKLS